MSKSQEGVTIGHVVGLWRYPVKSMGAEALTSVDVSWHGLAGDRRWAFVRDGVPASGFPWLTLRQRADLRDFRPRMLKPDTPDASPMIIETPSGDEHDVTAPELSDELEGARIIKQDRGIFDTFPLSLITTQTIAGLEGLTGHRLDPQRFRPNFLVESTSDLPFPEDAWVGHVLRIGSLRMRVDKRDGRCVVITIDPDTGTREPSILRAVADQRDGCLGVYGSMVEPGRVALNDPVVLDEAPAAT